MRSELGCQAIPVLVLPGAWVNVVLHAHANTCTWALCICMGVCTWSTGSSLGAYVGAHMLACMLEWSHT